MKCKDPCPGSCGSSAICHVTNHIPNCYCDAGFTGNPITACYPAPSKCHFCGDILRNIRNAIHFLGIIKQQLALRLCYLTLSYTPFILTMDLDNLVFCEALLVSFDLVWSLTLFLNLLVDGCVLFFVSSFTFSFLLCILHALIFLLASSCMCRTTLARKLIRKIR